MQFDHSPINPPREGYYGEAVFLAHWQELMSKKQSVFPNILLDYCAKIEQREASVAASVVCWLGTNMGRCFLEDGKRLSAHFMPQSGNGYLAAWAVHNKRVAGVNQNWRSLENTLSTDGIMPKLSANDYEVAEHIARWLSTDDGQQFIARCMTEIARHQKLNQLASYHQSGFSHLPIVKQLEAELAAGEA